MVALAIAPLQLTKTVTDEGPVATPFPEAQVEPELVLEAGAAQEGPVPRQLRLVAGGGSPSVR